MEEAQGASPDAAPQSEVKVRELYELVEQVRKQEEVVDEISSKLSAENKILNEMKMRAAGYVRELGQDEFRTPMGTIRLSSKWRWNLPESEEAWNEFKAHLQAKGLADKLLSINSASYVAYLNSLRKEAIEMGNPNWEPPGVPQGKMFETVSIVKGR